LPESLKERAGCKPCFYSHDPSRVFTSNEAEALERQLAANKEEAEICFNPQQTLHERIMAGGR